MEGCNFGPVVLNQPGPMTDRQVVFPFSPRKEGCNPMAKAAGKKPPTKSEILVAIAEATELKRPQVSAVLDALAEEIKKALKGPGVFAIPGLVKIEKKKVPARAAKKGVMVLGQLRDLPAKPASVKIKVRALKNLKSMI